MRGSVTKSLHVLKPIDPPHIDFLVFLNKITSNPELSIFIHLTPPPITFWSVIDNPYLQLKLDNVE